MTILSTILFLITRVLKETAVKSADNQVPPPVTAALQGIKTIVTLPTVKTDENTETMDRSYPQHSGIYLGRLSAW